jgi:hypothetical protein
MKQQQQQQRLYRRDDDIFTPVYTTVRQEENFTHRNSGTQAERTCYKNNFNSFFWNLKNQRLSQAKIT